jgi:hypothetical protein
MLDGQDSEAVNSLLGCDSDFDPVAREIDSNALVAWIRATVLRLPVDGRLCAGCVEHDGQTCNEFGGEG